MRGDVVGAVRTAVAVGGAPQARELVRRQEGARVPVRRTLLGETVATRLRLAGGGVRQGRLQVK